MSKTMQVYVDTEFNGFGRELISLGMVTPSGREWYRELPEPRMWNEWVFENVRPKLSLNPVSYDTFLCDLNAFLKEHDGCEFIADHPADFKHLSEQMDVISSRSDFAIPIECTMTLVRGSMAIQSENPHHALADAKALMKWHRGDIRGARDKSAMFGG